MGASIREGEDIVSNFVSNGKNFHINFDNIAMWRVKRADARDKGMPKRFVQVMIVGSSDWIKLDIGPSKFARLFAEAQAKVHPVPVE